MVKPSYEITEKRDVATSVIIQMPTEIIATVRAYRNGSYLWLPREWGGKKVVIRLMEETPEVKTEVPADDGTKADETSGK